MTALSSLIVSLLNEAGPFAVRRIKITECKMTERLGRKHKKFEEKRRKGGRGQRWRAAPLRKKKQM
jgi:hypothetical protein